MKKDSIEWISSTFGDFWSILVTFRNVSGHTGWIKLDLSRDPVLSMLPDYICAVSQRMVF
jgi:hypothetical protein